MIILLASVRCDFDQTAGARPSNFMRDAQSYQPARAIATKDVISEKQNGIFEGQTRENVPTRLPEFLGLKISIFLKLTAHVIDAAPGKMQRSAIQLTDGV